MGERSFRDVSGKAPDELDYWEPVIFSGDEIAAEADRLASSADLHFVRRAKGQYLPIASPEEAAAYAYAPIDRERIKHLRARLFVGSPATVRERLSALLAATRADEAMITTMIYDHGARKHSFELMAQAFELPAS